MNINLQPLFLQTFSALLWFQVFFWSLIVQLIFSVSVYFDCSVSRIWLGGLDIVLKNAVKRSTRSMQSNSKWQCRVHTKDGNSPLLLYSFKSVGLASFKIIHLNLSLERSLGASCYWMMMLKLKIIWHDWSPNGRIRIWIQTFFIQRLLFKRQPLEVGRAAVLIPVGRRWVTHLSY